MNTFFKILLVADAAVAAIALVVILVKCGKSYYRRAEKTAGAARIFGADYKKSRAEQGAFP